MPFFEYRLTLTLDKNFPWSPVSIDIALFLYAKAARVHSFVLLRHHCLIDHCTVSVAILDVGQSRQKLQQMYGMLFNFQR